MIVGFCLAKANYFQDYRQKGVMSCFEFHAGAQGTQRLLVSELACGLSGLCVRSFQIRTLPKKAIDRVEINLNHPDTAA
jgi:hypothetical protein